jgi:hypothetical protein
MDNSPNRPSKGMQTDNSHVDQPKGTTRFVLNGINETNQGDRGFIANEESNEQCYQLPFGYIPLGDVYIGDGNILVFSVKDDETLSEIGIADRDCNYTTVVNHNLGFRISQQIDAVFRLRRGCERSVYWVDPRLRTLNLDKLEEFKDSNGDWDPSKFRLFKTYSDIPIFEEVDIVEGGNLLPGSYNISIQYLDSDLNPTEWVTTSQTLMIYNDSVNKAYEDIRGSTNLVNSYQEFGATNKAIRIKFGNLDSSYPFYRIAVVEATTGTGKVSNVVLSQEIPSDITTYTYTGSGAGTTTVEEIQAFNTVIEFAEHIEQLENRLIPANVRGKQLNFCKLQKYASRIKADMVTKTVVLNAISDGNPKTGTVYFDGAGYMPGEIYSFGLVWVFEDGTLSPVYHIPGKNPTTDNISFTQTGLPMSTDNELTDTYYTDTNDCGVQDYWGNDSEGAPLLNQRVRHHRFPTRAEANLPLFSEDTSNQGNTAVNQLNLDIQGTIDGGYTDPIIEYSVEYTIDGNTFISTKSITVASYDSSVGVQVSITNSTKAITVDNIYENGAVTSNPAPSGLSYTTSIDSGNLTVGDKVFTSESFGIRFSGIDIPSLEDTNGERIVGYYIVRNERDQDNRTVLDSAVLAPLLDEEFFVGHAHIFPNLSDTSRIKTDTFALIHPEFSFFSNEYRNIDSIIKEGQFTKSGSASISDLLIQDTMAGSSFDPDVHKRRESDSDGFDLHIMARDNEVTYSKVAPVTLASGNEIEETFYLSALNSRVITDVSDVKKEVFNVSADNKVGIVKLDKELDVSEVNGKLPYVILGRTLTNPYQNFRVSPYYKETNDPQTYLFDGSGNVTFGDQINVFNGDAVVTPIRYTTSSYYDIRIRNRKTKSGLFNFILGAIAIVVGVVASVFTAGASTGLVAVGISAIGLGIAQVATGIKKEQIGKVWGELYEAGLRDTVQDDDTLTKLEYNVPDDEIQWFSDTITNLWFESTANAALRQGATVGIPDFLNAPANKSTISNTGRVDTPQNEVDSYILDKITNLDPDNGDGRLYQGFANAELYEINPDYLRRNREKLFSHLGIEYDCCSDCIETFTHRYHYSEQSFDEELTDNYRVFLPNNYRDIEGSSGDITNLYRFYDNLYIHTEEALWLQPKNYQERVTDEIVSFIGTGSYFEVPPKKMLDGEESSAGTRFKWGVTKTKHGIVFPSEAEGKIYMFDGKKLTPISEHGMSNWFRDNIPLISNRDYYKNNKRDYPFLNNPSNPYGVGFLSTYDTRKERLIITKKDIQLAPDIVGESDYELCTNGSSITIFRGYQQIISDYAGNGYEFSGVEGCRMKFTKTEYVSQTQTRYEYEETIIPNTADIHIFFDTSGSFDSGALAQIDAAVDTWIAGFQTNNPDWTGTLYKYNDSSERWLAYADRIATETYGGVTNDKDVIIISFCNESTPYHDGDLDATIPTTTVSFDQDYSDFVNTIYPAYNSFVGIHYPVVFPDGSWSGPSKNFLLHSLAALKGVSYSGAETDALAPNPGMTAGEWTTLTTALQGTNPYPDTGLDQYGWLIKEDRYNDSGTVIEPTQFGQDIEGLLQGFYELEQTETQVIVQVPSTDVQYVDGEVLTDFIEYNRSWTISYSLKNSSWTSFHSYIPDFYMYVPERFYSWKNGDNYLWKHNKIGNYQTFYGQYWPHIVEYVSVDAPIRTKIWDFITLQTEARSYSPVSMEFLDQRDVTFNKLLVYNSHQISGILDMVVKNTRPNETSYIRQQIQNTVGQITIDRTERDWNINELRDIRVDTSVPMFNRDPSSISTEYFIDKTVNPACLDTAKHWTQMESFRDKFLVVRLIFDTFDNIRLITNFSMENESISEH